MSTTEHAASELSLDTQRTAISAACRERGWILADVFEDAGVSLTARGRPGLDAALDACAARPASALVVARLDRLAPSLIACARLLERAEREGWALLALDASDASTAGDLPRTNVIAAVAVYERELISTRTRDALATARSRGVRLGRPPTTPDDVSSMILALRRQRATATAIAAHLNQLEIPPPGGGRQWYTSTVADILRRQGVHLTRGRPARRRRRRTASSEPVQDTSD